MPTELCAVRANLSQSVMAAVAESYRAKAEYDKAKQKQAPPMWTPLQLRY